MGVHGEQRRAEGRHWAGDTGVAQEEVEQQHHSQQGRVVDHEEASDVALAKKQADGVGTQHAVAKGAAATSDSPGAASAMVR